MLTKIKKVIRVFVIVLLAVASIQIGQGDAVAAPSTGAADNCPATYAEAQKLSSKQLSNCVACHPEYSGGLALNPDQLSSCTACTKAGLEVNATVGKDTQYCLKENVIVKRVNEIVNVLSGLVGIVVVGTIILGGIQYSLASGKQDSTANAKKRIMNGIIALVAYLLIFGFLQWLVPGGVL